MPHYLKPAIKNQVNQNLLQSAGKVHRAAMLITETT